MAKEFGKFQAEGTTIFALNDVGHNLIVLRVEPGCNCPKCKTNAKDRGR